MNKWGGKRAKTVEIKLNLGSGNKPKSGYVNVDHIMKRGVNRKYDISKPLDYDDNSIDLIEGMHIFEHIPRRKVYSVAKSWHRVLKKGKYLILEMPDFDEVIKWYQKKETSLSLMWIFGNQLHHGQFHYWGWNEKRLFKLLNRIGFVEINFPEPQDYHKVQGPCLRVEAKK